MAERIRPTEHKPVEPMTPSERGRAVDGFVGWMYDSFLALPEAVKSLKTASKGRRFNVSPQPSFEELSFDRLGFNVVLCQRVRGNRRDNASGLTKAARYVSLDIRPVVNTNNQSDYFSVNTDVQYTGDPMSDHIEVYEDGSMESYEGANLVGTLEDIEDFVHDSDLVDKVKKRITKMLGIEPEEASDGLTAMLRRMGLIKGAHVTATDNQIEAMLGRIGFVKPSSTSDVG